MIEQLLKQHADLLNRRLEYVWEYSISLGAEPTKPLRQSALVRRYKKLVNEISDIRESIGDFDEKILDDISSPNPEEIHDAFELYFAQAKKQNESKALTTIDNGAYKAKLVLGRKGLLEVYVNGEITETLPNSPFMKELLGELARAKGLTNEWRNAYEKLEAVAKDFIDEDTLREQLED